MIPREYLDVDLQQNLINSETQYLMMYLDTIKVFMAKVVSPNFQVSLNILYISYKYGPWGQLKRYKRKKYIY